MQLRKSTGRKFKSVGFKYHGTPPLLSCPSLQKRNGKSGRDNIMQITNKGYLHEINNTTRTTKRKEKPTTKNTIKAGINETRKRSQREPNDTKQSTRRKSKRKQKYIVKRPVQESSHVHVEENIAGAFELKFWSFWVESAQNVVSQIRGRYKLITFTGMARLIVRKLDRLGHSIYTSVNFPWKKRRKNIRYSALTATSSRPGR